MLESSDCIDAASNCQACKMHSMHFGVACWHVGMRLARTYSRSCGHLKKCYCPVSRRSCLLLLAWDPAVCPLALWCSFLLCGAEVVSAGLCLSCSCFSPSTCFGIFPLAVPVPLPLPRENCMSKVRSWWTSCLLLLMHFVFMQISTHEDHVSLSKCACVPLQVASIVVIQVASLLTSDRFMSGGDLSLDVLPTTTARLSSSAAAIADLTKQRQ